MVKSIKSCDYLVLNTCIHTHAICMGTDRHMAYHVHINSSFTEEEGSEKPSEMGLYCLKHPSLKPSGY